MLNLYTFRFEAIDLDGGRLVGHTVLESPKLDPTTLESLVYDFVKFSEAYQYKHVRVIEVKRICS